MLPDTFLDKLPAWTNADAPDAAEACFTHATLVRNLADYPFPSRCGGDERQAVEERIVQALDTAGLLSTGRYFPLPEFDARELRFLVERRLVTRDMMASTANKGVYVSDDQSLSLMVNGTDHLCLRVQMAGLQANEAWQRASAVDDALSGAVDFAFSERLGYLASELSLAGTGLKVGVTLHLPMLAQYGELPEQTQRVHSQHVVVRGIRAGSTPPTDAPARANEAGRGIARGESRANQSLYSDIEGPCWGPLHEALGDLYLLSNESTLGLSEEELLFNINHAARELIEAERRARQRILQDNAIGLEDRIGRARGIAAGARIMGFTEAAALLSALRLGVAMGMLPDHTFEQMNELLLTAQGAHLELAHGEQVDVAALNQARADHLRAVFSN